jgi:hypothetical protein
MTRLERKNDFQESDVPASRGVFGLMDGVMMKVFRINDDELDKICQIASDDELELFTKEDRTISESKMLLTFLQEKIYTNENTDLLP